MTTTNASKKPGKGCLARLGDLSLVLLVVFCLVVLASNLGIGPLAFKPVLSGSMAPTINPGDFAIIYKTDKPSQIGDVVLFHSEGTEIIHRVVNNTEFGYLTQGDANEEPDPNTVAFSQVEGKYITRIPLIGYLLVFIKLAVQGVFS